MSLLISRRFYRSTPLVVVSSLFYFHLDLFGFGLLGLQRAHFQNAILEGRFYFVRVHRFGQFNAAHEAAIGPFTAIVVFLFDFFFFFLLAFDRQRAVGNIHLDMFLVHAGEFGFYDNVILVFEHVESRGAHLHLVTWEPVLRPPGTRSSPQEILHHSVHISFPARHIHRRLPRRHRSGCFVISFVRHKTFPLTLKNLTSITHDIS